MFKNQKRPISRERCEWNTRLRTNSNLEKAESLLGGGEQRRFLAQVCWQFCCYFCSLYAVISLGFCIACVASDSFFFFLSSQLSRRSRAETLAMQASFCIKALIVLARPTLSLLALRKSQLWTSWNRCWFTRTNGLNLAFAARLCCINYYIFSNSYDFFIPTNFWHIWCGARGGQVPVLSLAIRGKIRGRFRDKG